MSARATLALAIEVKGEIIKSNFEAFKAQAIEQIESVNLELTTDADFGQAELDVKGLKAFEETVSEAEENMLRELDDVYKLIEGTREIKGLAAEKRLALNKLVTTQKKVIREQIKSEALGSIPVAHPDASTRIEAAMKNKRTLESLRSHAEKEAAAITAEVEAAQKLVDDFEEKHGKGMTFDSPKLVVMSAELLAIELERRLERKHQEEEKARLRAEAAKQEEKPAEPAKPADPPVYAAKVDPIPVRAERPKGETAQEEMERFLATIEMAFAPVKAARAELKHKENIVRAARFAGALGESWRNLKGLES